MQERESDTNEVRMTIEDVQKNALIFGSGDDNLDRIREAFGVEIVQRGDDLVITGRQTQKAKEAILDFLWILDRDGELDGQKAEYVLSLCRAGMSYRQTGLNDEVICFTHRGKPISAKTLGQIAYARSIRE